MTPVPLDHEAIEQVATAGGFLVVCACGRRYEDTGRDAALDRWTNHAHAVDARAALRKEEE